jgi:hypothetical protein
MISRDIKKIMEKGTENREEDEEAGERNSIKYREKIRIHMGFLLAARKRRPDLVIDFERRDTSSAFAFLSGARIRAMADKRICKYQ